MSSSGRNDADVVVVGCGPVGLTLAIQLAQFGRSVIVLERFASPYPLPRAVHFDHEVGRILQSCGVGEGLRAVTEPAGLYEWRNGEGTVLLRFGRHGDGASGWPDSSMFNQPALEALLEARAGELASLDIRRGVEVVDVSQGGDGVVVTDAEGTEVRARYAVGCDGTNSTVRSLAGIEVDDQGFFYDWLIVDVIFDEPRVFEPNNLQVCDPNRPTTAVSGGPGRRRWEFMRLPHESIEDLRSEERAWELLEPWDAHPGNATLERHAVYTFNARHAATWRNGRILLAGDAAHQMPPFAGQGMCAGIRDAANLAWKLDLVLDGRAGDGLLDTYEVERLPSAMGAIAFSMELGKIICVPDPDEAAMRDAAMSASVGDEPSEVPPMPGIEAGLIHPSAPHAGHLFVQGEIEGEPFDLVHGVGWRLVTVDGEPLDLDDDTAAWFASLGGTVVRIAEPDARLTRWFGDHGCTWALQRPDFHLYGAAGSASEAAGLLSELRRHLQTFTTTSPPPPTTTTGSTR